ncbi:MAG: folate family ECF transporter S component [Acutalibacteraceae bacterium]|nr:folate family ECF transporter S component [Acutalibacteraceae bacterium]
MNNVLKKEKTEVPVFEFSPVQLIAFGAIFMALRVVLGFFEINIGDSYRITFSPIPVTLSAYMLGPVFGGVIGACGDLITLILHPTGGINFGILLAKTLWGVLMGAFLYKKKITILRSIVANVVAIIICNVIITTISLCVAYGYPLEAILPIRLITNAILLPIYIVATYFFVMLIDKVYTKIKPRYSH